MKNIKYILLSLAALSFVSCNEDAFLTENPKTLYSMENAFEKTTQADAALVTAYDQFNYLHGFGLFVPLPGMEWMGTGVPNFLHGDGSDMLAGTRGYDDFGLFNNYPAVRSNHSWFRQLWTDLYKLASYANMAMQGLDVLEASEADETYMMAQARFFRGWAYLRLAECYGGVPLVEELLTDLKYDYVRSTREETYQFAINDLAFAAENLPDYPKTSGRMAAGVANHFLSEAYLGLAIEMGDDKATLSKAVEAADKVIAAHPLMTARFGSRSAAGTQPAGVPDNGVPRVREDGNVFFDLFQIGNFAYSDGNRESLMIIETPSYEQAAINGGNVIPFHFVVGGEYHNLKFNAEYAEEGAEYPWFGKLDESLFPGGMRSIRLSNGSWGILQSTDYSDEYVWRDEFADDERNAQINRYNPVVGNVDSKHFGKVVTKDMLEPRDAIKLARVSSKTTSVDIWGYDLAHCYEAPATYGPMYQRDWYIARSAETYLLRAEAKLRSGDAQGAADDVNAVRSRSKASKLYGAGEVDIYVIMDERARELSFEEMRWPTLLRMGSKGKNEVLRYQLETHSQHYAETHMLSGSYGSWTLFPIPLDVIQLNSEAVLEQNPGWDN